MTDFANPQLTSNVILGADTGASSEAIYNPKAFTYYAERGLVALPISIYDNPVFFFEDDLAFEMDGEDGMVSGGRRNDDGTVSGGSSGSAPPPDVLTTPIPDEPLPDRNLPVEPTTPYVPGGFEGLVIFSASPEAGLVEVGRISTRYPDANIYWSSYTRGVFIDDDVCAVTDRAVRRAQASNVEAIVGELVFE